MDVNFEYVDPFDEKYDYLMRVEHLGRYLFASDVMKGLNTVLDVACADGYGTKIISSNVSKVVGIDRNEEYLKIAKLKNSSENISFKCVDVDESKIDGIYDGIVCFETLEHLKYPERFLNNLYQVLERNGILLLSVPNLDYEIIENGKNKDAFHLHVFEYDEIIELIKKIGFSIKAVYGQSYINKIVNEEIIDYKLTNVNNDGKTIGYPNDDDIKKTYSYVFVLKKE